MSLISQKLRVLLHVSSGLQSGAHPLQQPLGCLLCPLWEPCEWLMSLQNPCSDLGFFFSLGSPSLSEVCLASGSGYANVWQSNRAETTCSSPTTHPPLQALGTDVHQKQAQEFARVRMAKKELGIWPMIMVSITGSSAVVIATEKDGDHSVPFLFASSKHHNCFVSYTK